MRKELFKNRQAELCNFISLEKGLLFLSAR